MNRRLVAALSLSLLVVASSPGRAQDNPWTSAPDPEREPIPKWIWGPKPAAEGEAQNFRIAFDAKVPEKTMTEDPSSALVWAAGDDDMHIFLNGNRIGHLSRQDGQNAILIDVRGELKHGTNVLTVSCTNKQGPAGICLKLAVRGQYREPYFLITDGNWKVTNAPPRNWRNPSYDDSKAQVARVIGPYGIDPWGKLEVAPPANQATPSERLHTLAGYKAELLYSVPKGTQGSWVSMTPDPKGRLYVSDQSGSLFRVTPGRGASDTRVEPVPAEIGSAQGLLWANDSLYVVINGSYKGKKAGLYRVTDTDGDDRLDDVKLLLPFKGRTGENASGEHGPHAVVLGPDKKLYVVAGNFTNLPDSVAKNSPAARYGEDLLLPRETDGKGHDPNIMFPGGWVCRMDPDGSHVEAFVTGMRNTYDIAFAPDGELFGYDSDMEWDVGAPWYRPTRVLHCVSGAEFGWRNGSGKWPAYYPDSLPAVVDTALGSPTGITFGTGAKFPARYQHALFASDWAYGRIYAVHLKPDGSSYTGTAEPFIWGKPFDVTDCVIGADGAMYITIGGRGTQSGLYRVTYTGTESTAPAPYPRDSKSADARLTRRRLEFFHGNVDPAAVDYAWPYLNSDDRHLRYAARMAIESQPLDQWQSRALGKNKPTAAINALLGLCRVAPQPLEPEILAALDRIGYRSLSKEQKLELLRTYGVCFIRLGRPDARVLADHGARWDKVFPSGDTDLDHELCQLLVYCDVPSVVAKSMKLLAAANTQEEQMFYAHHLRTQKSGWTPELRKAYFSWFNFAEDRYTGGASYKLFLQHIREHAAELLSPDERAALEPILHRSAASIAGGPATPSGKPLRVIRDWQMEQLTPRLSELEHGRSFERGRQAFETVGCVKCHRFGNENAGTSGPDLTGVGNRFSPYDLLESIIKPSKVISDQYADTKIVTKDHTVFVGAIQSEDAEKVVVRPNPLSPDTQVIRKKDITKRGLSNLSPMPSGLLNVLTENEILDLLAYLRSAGNKDDPAFAKR